MSEWNAWVAGMLAAAPFVEEHGPQDPAAHRDPHDSPGNAPIVAPNGAPSARHGSPKKDQRTDPLTVLRAFNTWAFKREQPSDPQFMLKIISESIALGAAIPFVLYWGKGPRCKIAQPDSDCLDYLARLARRVQQAYQPGASIRLVFTDTHAELNGHSPHSVRRYFSEVDVAARQRGFESCWLGPITRAAVEAAGGALAYDDISEETLTRLFASARKWYHGKGTYEEGALKYFQMNAVERRAVEFAFPSSIFVTFNGSEHRVLFPQRLPIFYMYSLRRGVSIKPWYLPVEATACNDSSCQCRVLQ
jgi:L-tyrosine isonitrile synthase